MKEYSFLNGGFVPALTAYEYRGYIIAAWARPELMNRSTSVGIVYRRDPLGAIIQVKRIVGALFDSKEQAEQHGVELCKEWIDNLIELNTEQPQRNKATA
jgi:hypothetical protein